MSHLSNHEEHQQYMIEKLQQEHEKLNKENEDLKASIRYLINVIEESEYVECLKDIALIAKIKEFVK